MAPVDEIRNKIVASELFIKVVAKLRLLGVHCEANFDHKTALANPSLNSVVRKQREKSVQQTKGIIDRLVNEIVAYQQQIRMTGVTNFYPAEALLNIKRVADSLENEQRSEELQKGLNGISKTMCNLRDEMRSVSSDIKNTLKTDIQHLSSSIVEASSTLQNNQDQQFEYLAEQMRALNGVLAA